MTCDDYLLICQMSCYFECTLQPVKMMEDFLRLAQANTEKNLETCGVLAGSLVRSHYF